MAAYINGMACISHHKTFNKDYFFEDAAAVPMNNCLLAAEPVYNNYIPASLIRRMSRIVKMGVSTAMMSMNAAGVEKVDAIITGTGMGCVEDTDVFLRSLLDNNEELLTPTSFIRSTHNTVGGQIALLIKCTGYNFTYVHQNLSFEYALLDAMLLLQEDESKTVLVGGIDEITSPMFEIFKRGGHIKETEELQPLWNNTGKGYVIGEGAGFLNLSTRATPGSSVKISGVKCIQELVNADELMNEVNAFLEETGIQKQQISLVLAGNCGDNDMDKDISEFNNSINLPVAYFKHLCGEYFTSATFAVWLAASIIMKQVVPKVILPGDIHLSGIEHILIVNHYQGKQYSLICISA